MAMRTSNGHAQAQVHCEEPRKSKSQGSPDELWHDVPGTTLVMQYPVAQAEVCRAYGNNEI